MIRETQVLGSRLRYRALEVWTPDGVCIEAQDWGESAVSCASANGVTPGARGVGEAPRADATDPGVAPGSRRDVLFIHGISQSHLCWHRQFASPLRERFRLVTYDLRGHGDSAKPLAPEFYRDGSRWANEVQAVIEVAGLHRPVLVAWSYAGRVALDYLLTGPQERIAALVMIAGTSNDARSLFGPAAPALARMTAAQDRQQDIEATTDFLQACVSGTLPDEELQLMLDYNLRVPIEVRAAMGGRPAPYGDLLASLSLPVLAIHGAEDALILPTMTAYTVQTCRRARAIIYPGVGHTPFWEAPARFNADLSGWMDEL